MTEPHEWVPLARDEIGATAEDGTRLIVTITVTPYQPLDAEHYQVARKLVTQMARDSVTLPQLPLPRSSPTARELRR